MTKRLVLALAASVLVAACTASVDDDVTAVQDGTLRAECGGSGQACCATGPRCNGELGCSANVCSNIDSDMVAYTEYCKEQLGFVNPRLKMQYLSCYTSAAADGSRASTGRQALLSLSSRDASGNVTKHDLATEPAQWEHIFGGTSASGESIQAEGCDNPNYLQSRCDPYYRLNVFKPDPANPDITAAIHCRSDGTKPASSVLADARLADFEASPTSERLFDSWNDSNEIVLMMANTKSGKACFFHAKSPYFGSHFPAPDDETDLAQPGADTAVWNELPVTPPFPMTDAMHRSEWLRNGKNAWQRPDYMRCVGCHDSGPFMHDPFIDSTNRDGADYLPRDRANRPYMPLGWQARSNPKTFLKTGPVKDQNGELGPQRCTTCHQMGTENQCYTWFDRAVGWTFPYSASAESKSDESLKRYMPFEHGFTNSADFYKEYGPSLDAMKCCCEHSDWRGCKKVPAATPTAPGTEGTDARSCTESVCGGWNQPCCEGTYSSCNHSGLTCNAGTCKFKDE